MSDDSLKKDIREAVLDENDIGQPYQQRCLELLESKYGKLDFSKERIKLNRITIEGYKGIPELNYNFSNQATIFRGRNSRGKSSLIQAIRFNALGRKDGNNALVTNPIRSESDSLVTHAYWQKNSSISKVTRQMKRAQGYTGYDKPDIIENPNEDSKGEDGVSERKTQFEADELIGMTPLYEEGVDRFNAFSLFTVIDGDLTQFYGSDDNTDIIEFLFGIKLTRLRRAVEEQTEEAKPDEQSDNVWSKRHQFKAQAEGIAKELKELQDKKEQAESQIDELRSEKEDLESILENENEVNKVLLNKIKIRDKITDLQSREEKLDEQYKTVKQEISKLKNEAVTEEIAPALQEMQQYLAIPDHCPVCTSEISDKRKKEFHSKDACPLCSEQVPSERRDTVSEVDQQGEILEHEKRQKELNELDKKRREIKGEIEHLREEISRKKARIDKIEKEQEQPSYREYKRQKVEIEDKISDLSDEIRYLNEQIISSRDGLHEAALQHWKWEQTLEENQEQEQKRMAFEKFESIINDERKSARENLKTKIRKKMESFLSIFKNGTFEDANGVRMEEGQSYSFTVVSQYGTEHNPGLLDEANAELTLHMLLFHTAILSLLQEQSDTIPFRVFLIDSPYGNGQDTENIRDITNFLKEIPDLLSEFQVIGTMADPTFDHWQKLEDVYRLTSIEEHIDQ